MLIVFIIGLSLLLSDEPKPVRGTLLIVIALIY